MSIGYLFPHSTPHLDLLSIVLMPVGAMGGTIGQAVVQQASASCCKDVHPYNPPALNKTQGITIGIHGPR